MGVPPREPLWKVGQTCGRTGYWVTLNRWLSNFQLFFVGWLVFSCLIRVHCGGFDARSTCERIEKCWDFFRQPKISLTKIVAYALLIIDTVSTARDTIGTRSGNQFWSISLLHFDSRAQEQRKDLIIDLDWLRFLQLNHVLQSVPLKNRDWRIDPAASSVNVQSGSFLPSLFRLDWTEIRQTSFKESDVKN